MYIFWNNILKFPKFFISVLSGFFLTIVNSLFESLKTPKQGIIIIIALSLLFIFFVQVLRLMLAIN
uniref:Uncharacterized protein ycf33 n=1 Tax=Porolithon onkodes TaxID=231751 RepID=A0A2Z2KYR9_9FLOR|nr:hypothetical protein Ycf33 [Porolithon onkodes]ASB29681.1 hypothetical protein Ycf33 [Porolithon onkodes]